MAAIVLKGSTATYIGKEKGWEHRRNKKMTLLKDTRTSSVQYKFLFEEENVEVLVNYENIAWCQKQMDYTDEPTPKYPDPRKSKPQYAYWGRILHTKLISCTKNKYFEHTEKYTIVGKAIEVKYLWVENVMI